MAECEPELQTMFSLSASEPVVMRVQAVQPLSSLRLSHFAFAVNNDEELIALATVACWFSRAWIACTLHSALATR